MNRREFLRYAGLFGISFTFENPFPRREAFADLGKVEAGIKNIRIIDAHAHPDRYLRDPSRIDTTSTLKAMEEVGFSHDEIAAYMGGNFYRVLRSCIG